MTARPQRIAIVGTGIAGSVAAYRLHAAGHAITVFEADARPGGHTHTHEIERNGQTLAVDTGFIVFNDRTYPHFVALLRELGVSVQDTVMSFSVRNDARNLEYNGTSLNGLFAQRRNIVDPRFLRMIAEILRFHRVAPTLLAANDADVDAMPLGDFLAAHRFGGRFVEDYLVPMGAAIWSTDPARMLAFPARFFVRFLHNHGMLTVDDRPTWHTVRGGSARYLDRLMAPWRHRVRLATPVERVQRQGGGVQIHARGHSAEHFDHVFLACHADQALAMLADPAPEEREILGALQYQRNEAVLHTDTSLLPARRRAWAAWNYHVPRRPGGGVTLTYDMNILQRLAAPDTYCVTLNATADVDPRKVLRTMTYDHPLFTPAGIAAQKRHAEISGVRRTHYCGAYWRYGFHEDGVVSAMTALQRFEETSDAQRALPRVA
ncbi:MAG: FAD-dependent oxidoreductase [Proteobacteria bacterium]|nr:FAD-dependent oxidoreductase [Pseudomonadota bacterium]